MNNIYCIIMAGGLGSRLWPLSQASMPKQFIDLMGLGRTMLQLTFDRFSSMCDTEHFVVVTNEEYYETVCQQLPEIPLKNILREPFRRNTATCIAFATAYIKQLDPNAVCVVTPADHLILNEMRFVKSVQTAVDFAAVNDALVTVGVKAHKPETAFGYIQFGDPVGDNYPQLHLVKTFTEKPNLEMAQIFFECGEFVWNSGVFAWSISSIEKALQKFLPNTQKQFTMLDAIPRSHWTRESVRMAYDECENISIDYGVMERAQNVYVELTDAAWSDLGSWEAIYEQGQKDQNGNTSISGQVILKGSKDCLVDIPAGKTCIADGMDGYMIVDNGEMLLICPRSKSHLTSSYAAEISAATE